MVKKAIINTNMLDWNVRTSINRFSRFRSVQCHYEVCYLWKFSKLFPGMLTYVKSVAQLVAYLTRYDEVCYKCTDNCNGCCLTDHLILDCPRAAPIRANITNGIYKKFGQHVYNCITHLERSEYVNTLLGVYHPVVEASLPVGSCYDDLLQLLFVHMHHVCRIGRSQNE